VIRLLLQVQNDLVRLAVAKPGARRVLAQEVAVIVGADEEVLRPKQLVDLL
jgi:hypothetical protein